MRVNITNEVLSIEDGTYAATIKSIQSYGEDDGIIVRLLLEDGRTLIRFYKLDDLGSYPWNNLFRALNSEDTDDLIGKNVEVEIVNSISKISGNEFCNIRKIKLI